MNPILGREDGPGPADPPYGGRLPSVVPAG